MYFLLHLLFLPAKGKRKTDNARPNIVIDLKLLIHNNTVQYRLKKANEILGAEMTANRIIPGLTMALAIKRLEEI